ncbi:MAG: PAS domain-containing protein [Betaproteobacteria bacterium]|nr:PAS domain-containing protein [Betaproteobacteria bacterium]
MGSVDFAANPAGKTGGQRQAGPSLQAPAWLVAAGALLAIAALLAALLGLGPQHGAWFTALVVAGVLLAAAAAALFGYGRGFAALYGAVRRANDGSLEPIELQGLSRPLLAPLATEYNLLARNLGSLFREMEQAQLSIIAERNRHEAILHGLPGALLAVDDEFRITLSNRQAEALFGIPAAELVGTNVFNLLHSDDMGREVLREAFLYEQQVSNKVLTLAIDGRPRHVSLNLTFFQPSTHSAQASAAIILQDITDWKRLEDMSQQAEKLVSMGQLAAGVAHELNTPLGTILGYAQLLNEGKANEEKRAEYARIIHEETRRCARIIDNLLAYARRDVCQGETCEINGLIREAVEAVANCQGRRFCATVEADVQGELVVRGGPGQLDIVLVNVMVNAVQAAATAEKPLVTVKSAAEGGFGVISITDNGPGIAPDAHGKLFDPFFTTKSESAGTGLGLAISHSIVTRIGGAIQCDPAYEGGARFVITLPLAA